MNVSEVRVLETSAVKLRQPRTMVQITATNSDIPLNEDWTQRWTTLPGDFQYHYEKVLDLQLRSDDVFVVTFMKCGTTWMQEISWLLLNNLDYETARKEHLRTRSPFVDFSGLYQKVPVDFIDLCNKLPSPRLIKSHLPANLLPKQLWKNKQKLIYVARNVKDVVVSSYHFLLGLGTWSGNMEEYVDDFINSEIMYTPYWPHILDFWQLRHEPHIFFVTYEEMKQNLAGVIGRLCKFLERPALNEEELQKLMDHVSFKNMRDNKKVNLTESIRTLRFYDGDPNFQFMRRGIVGSYKDELTPELQKKLNIWSQRFLEKYGIKEGDIFESLE